MIEGAALSSLALLEARAQGRGSNPNRLDLFMPLVIDALHSFPKDQFTAKDIQTKIRSDFGLELPESVLMALLGACRRNGLLERSAHVFWRTEKRLESESLTEKKREIEEKHKKLIEELMRFGRERGVEIHTAKKARKALACYLDRNFRDISVRALPDVSGQEGADENCSWVHEFFIDAEKTNPESIDTACALVRGRIVYDAAFLPGFEDGRSPFEGLTAYLDSPVICRALGYATEVEQLFVCSAIETMKRVGITCRVLETTVDEITRVLGGICDSWGSIKQDESPNSYSYCMVQRGIERNEVWRVSQDPAEEIMRVLDIEIAKATQRNREYVADERALAERLKKRNGVISDPRIWHDVNCVASVLTERADRKPRKIEDAGCFFVTLSTMTIVNTRKWWKEDEHRSDLAPIFSIVDLANYAWLYDTSTTTDSYTKNAIMATCAASMSPSEQVWQRWSLTLERYVREGKITSDVAKAILYSNDAKSVIYEYDRRGLLDGGEDGSFEEALEEICDRIADSRNDTRLEKARADHADEVEKLKREIVESRNASEAALRKYDSLSERFSASEQRVKDMVAERDVRDERLGRTAERLSRLITVVLILFGGALWALAVHLIVASTSDGFVDGGSLAGIIVSALAGAISFAIALAPPCKKRVECWLLAALGLDRKSSP